MNSRASSTSSTISFSNIAESVEVGESSPQLRHAADETAQHPSESALSMATVNRSTAASAVTAYRSYDEQQHAGGNSSSSKKSKKSKESKKAANDAAQREEDPFANDQFNKIYYSRENQNDDDTVDAARNCLSACWKAFVSCCCCCCKRKPDE
jgi:hypothetical protein